MCSMYLSAHTRTAAVAAKLSASTTSRGKGWTDLNSEIRLTTDGARRATESFGGADRERWRAGAEPRVRLRTPLAGTGGGGV